MDLLLPPANISCGVISRRERPIRRGSKPLPPYDCYNKTSTTCLTNPYRNWRPVPWRASPPPQSPEELEAVRVDAVGRKGALAEISKGMGKLAPEERKRIGQVLNAAKQELEAALDARKQRVRRTPPCTRASTPSGSISPSRRPAPRRGHLHPITRIQRELEELFLSLGFTVLDGPEVETEYYNFDALNIPPDHPARDMQDTFWLDGGNPAAHPHLARAGARHGAPRAAAAHDRARPRLPQ